jgi:glycosyltransferase involved in cell wall biosynthesis
MQKNDGPNFGVYAFAKFESPSAQLHYRLKTPLHKMAKMGLAEIVMDNGRGDRSQAGHYLIGADIAVAWHLMGEDGLRTIEGIRAMEPLTDNGKFYLPPLFVYDIDDAIEYVHPLNPSYASYGVKGWDGEELQPGDKIAYDRPDGSEAVLWEDKVSPGQDDEIFDIQKNRDRLALHYQMAKLSHGMTVTCEELKSIYVLNGVPEENIYVFPNSVDESAYYFPKLAPRPKKEVRIIWEGGSSHMESFVPIKPALIKILNENPKVKFVSFGNGFPWMHREIRPEQLELHEWEDHSAYKVKRHILGCDINIAPLLDTPFSKSKSAIRFYEASLGPDPEATVAANVGPYKEIEHGKTGLLYDTPEEFYEHVTALIKNAELRKTLAAGAREWVLANRSADKTVPGLFEFYQELKTRQRREALAI